MTLTCGLMEQEGWACGEARRLGGRAVAVFTSPDAGAIMAAICAAAGYPAPDPAVGEQAEDLATCCVRRPACY